VEDCIAAKSFDDVGQKLHLKAQLVGNATLQHVRYLSIEIRRIAATKFGADNGDVVSQRHVCKDMLETPPKLSYLFLATPQKRDGSMRRLVADHGRSSR
jgi:hypothetical protein